MKLLCGLFCNTYLLCGLLYETFSQTLIEVDDVASATTQYSERNGEKDPSTLTFLDLSLTLSFNPNLGLYMFTRGKL